MKIRWKSDGGRVLDSVTALVMLSTAVFLFGAAGRRLFQAAPRYVITEPGAPTELLSLQNGVVAGCRTASVAVILYEDFQCEACAWFASETLPSLWRYVESCRLRVAFRNLPVASVHPFAVRAAEAAVCAAKQGRFRPMQELLYSNGHGLENIDMTDRARRLGLNWGEFQLCLDSNAALPQIRLEAGEAMTLGVSATPTLLFGVVMPGDRLKVLRRISGAMPFAKVEEIVGDLVRLGQDTASGPQ